MKAHASRYNSGIFKRSVGLPKNVVLFPFQLAHSKEEERLCDVGSFTKSEWKPWHSTNRLWDLGNRLWLANCRPHAKGYCHPPQDALQAYWEKIEAFSF